MKQTIRIIGGKFRGKKIQFPALAELRPTPDRVKETVFNWLMQDIKNARCLDAFAGSGSLGFEAFSRGAARVVMVEQAGDACANLRNIAAQFNSNILKIIQADTLEFLKKSSEEFDIVFLDPPFAKDYLPECLKSLAHQSSLSKDGLVYIESGEPINVDLSTWEMVRSKQAGMVFYGLYRKLSS